MMVVVPLALALMVMLVFFVHKHVLVLHSFTAFFSSFFMWNVSLIKIAVTIYFRLRCTAFTSAHIHTLTHTVRHLLIWHRTYSTSWHILSTVFLPLQDTLPIFNRLQDFPVEYHFERIPRTFCVCGATYKNFTTTVSMATQCAVVNFVVVDAAVAAAWKSNCCEKLFSESERE